MEKVHFFICLGGSVHLSPKMSKDTTLAELLLSLLGEMVGQKGVTIYKFGTPLSAISGTGENLIEKIASARADWIKFSLRKRVKDLAEDQYLCDEYVCLIVELPPGQPLNTVTTLWVYHNALFKSLQIDLENFKFFSKDDVLHNLGSDDFWGHGEPRTNPAINQLETDLAAKRTFDTPIHSDIDIPSDFDIAMRYPQHFAQYFTQRHSTSESVVDDAREFIAFFSLFRCHAKDADRISDMVTSSHMKAHHLATHFLLPPFFVGKPSNSKTTFKTESHWKFPIFLGTFSSWCRFTPASDFSVFVDEYHFPLLVCEAIPKTGSDRWCMLLQGIALARALYCLRKRESLVTFFIVVVHLRTNLIAERYIIMQTDPTGKVAIAQTDYDLKSPDRSRDFLKEMFNLQIKLDAMTEELDSAKKEDLRAIAKVAAPITSLSQRREQELRWEQPTPEGSTSEESTSEESQNEYNFTQDADVLECLNEIHCVSDALVAGHENVAMISRASDPNDHGFLKFTTTATEVKILNHLMNIAAPDNHTISGVRVWPRRSGGFVIYTPSGGNHLTDLRYPDKHVWSAAKQLIEGVAFMHKHRVAHLDIKPANVLIPVDGGRLSIIDFSLAMFVKTPEQRVRGTVGTEGYIAPEVLAWVAYDPIRADLWSCGKTVLRLATLIHDPSKNQRQKEFLLGISQQLMVCDPRQRPTMSEVFDRMVVFESDSVEPPQMSIS